MEHFIKGIFAKFYPVFCPMIFSELGIKKITFVS